MIDISDLNLFSNIFEIPLSADPNYTFDTFINDKTFTFQIRTFINNETRISILQDGLSIVNYSPINIYQKNISFYSDLKDGAFFFLRNSSMIGEPTFLNFNENDLRLFYGNF